MAKVTPIPAGQDPLTFQAMQEYQALVHSAGFIGQPGGRERAYEIIVGNWLGSGRDPFAGGPSVPQLPGFGPAEAPVGPGLADALVVEIEEPEVDIYFVNADPALAGPPTKTTAIAALIAFIVKNPEVLEAIKAAFELVLRRAPAEARGPAPELALACLVKQLPKSHREAICQYEAGFPAPIGLSKTAQEVFLALLIADSVNFLELDPETYFIEGTVTARPQLM